MPLLGLMNVGEMFLAGTAEEGGVGCATDDQREAAESGGDQEIG